MQLFAKFSINLKSAEFGPALASYDMVSGGRLLMHCKYFADAPESCWIWVGGRNLEIQIQKTAGGSKQETIEILLLSEQNHPWAAGGRGAIQTSVLASSIVAMTSSLQNKPRQNRFQQIAIHRCHGVSVEGHCRPWYQETGWAVKVFISLNYGGSLLFTLLGVNYCRNIKTRETRDYILEFLQSSTSK